MFLSLTQPALWGYLDILQLCKAGVKYGVNCCHQYPLPSSVGLPFRPPSPTPYTTLCKPTLLSWWRDGIWQEQAGKCPLRQHSLLPAAWQHFSDTQKLVHRALTLVKIWFSLLVALVCVLTMYWNLLVLLNLSVVSDINNHCNIFDTFFGWCWGHLCRFLSFLKEINPKGQCVHPCGLSWFSTDTAVLTHFKITCITMRFRSLLPSNRTTQKSISKLRYQNPNNHINVSQLHGQ